jgi:hypothetical protein
MHTTRRASAPWTAVRLWASLAVGVMRKDPAVKESLADGARLKQQHARSIRAAVKVRLLSIPPTLAPRETRYSHHVRPVRSHTATTHDSEGPSYGGNHPGVVAPSRNRGKGVRRRELLRVRRCTRPGTTPTRFRTCRRVQADLRPSTRQGAFASCVGATFVDGLPGASRPASPGSSPRPGPCVAIAVRTTRRRPGYCSH